MKSMSQLCLKVKHLQAKQLLSQCSSHGRLVRFASNKKEDEPAKLPKTTKSLLAMKREKSLDPNTAKDDKTIIVGPDGIPYDYTKDMHYNDDLQFYRYPQYFTNYMTPQRVVNIIKEDFSLIHKHGRLHKVREELGTPREIDVAIFGGGAVGASIAYALKSRVPTGLSVAIFERDPTYTTASTVLSAGGIRQQFSLPENILMSMYTAEFLRKSRTDLAILDHDAPDLSFNPQGYLLLASNQAEAEQLLENHKLQIELGAMVELYTPSRLKQKFPFLNVDGIVLGSYGVQNEGWFDPWALLMSLKAKAMFYGVEYVHADVVDFNFKTNMERHVEAISGDLLETCNHVILREPNGNYTQCQFSIGIVCAGYNSSQIATLLGYGQRAGVRAMQFPVEPRKRYVYAFNCKDGPGLDMPFLVDPSGAYCRREGLGGNYICGISPKEDEEPDVSNLDVDYSVFDEKIHSLLANRIPAFEAIKLKSGWAGYYDYTTLDQNPIIGRDPYFGNVLWATGFSGHGIQMAPAVGRAITEFIIDGNYRTIDLSRFSWNRILREIPLQERNII